MKNKPHKPTQEFIETLNNVNSNFFKSTISTDGSKPFIKVKDDLGNKFKLTFQDFVCYMDECLSELETPGKSVQHYEEQRQILFETYFTFRFFARENNWDCKEMNVFTQTVNSYLRGYCLEISK